MELPEGITQRGKRSFRIDYRNADGIRQFETIKGDTPELALAEAIRTLAIRYGQIAEDVRPVTSKPNTITFQELCKAVIEDYKAHRHASLKDMERRYRKHLLPYLGHWKAKDIDLKAITKYITHRQEQGSSDGNIDLELQAMKRAFKLGIEQKQILEMPKIAMLDNGIVRMGYFKPEQLEALCRHLPAHLVPPVRFAYITGWRLQEVMTRCWKHVDDRGVWVVHGEAKAKKEIRVFPMGIIALKKLIDGIRPENPDPEARLFPQPDGSNTTTFYKAWATALRKADLPHKMVPVMKVARNADGSLKRDERGDFVKETVILQRGKNKGKPMMRVQAGMIFHDFRRTAIKNLKRLGITPAVAEAAVGWLDPATARRYEKVDEGDLALLTEKFNAADPTGTGITGAKNVVFGANFTTRAS